MARCWVENKAGKARVIWGGWELWIASISREGGKTTFVLEFLKNQGNNLFYLRKLPKSTSNLAKQSFEPSVFKATESEESSWQEKDPSQASQGALEEVRKKGSLELEEQHEAGAPQYSQDCLWGCNSRNCRCQSAGSVPQNNLRELETRRKPKKCKRGHSFHLCLSERSQLHKNQRHDLLNLECSLRLMH